MTTTDQRRVITSETERRAATQLLVLLPVLAVLSIYGVLSHYNGPPTTMTSRVLSIIAVLSLAYVGVRAAMRRPPRLVPRSPRTDDPRARRLCRRLNRSWLRVTRDAGLTREERDPDTIHIHAPRIIDLTPVPLGVAMTVQTLPGQPAEEVVKRADHIASALGVWLRADVSGPSTVRLIAELHDPLKGIRNAGHPADTEIVVGRCDDGEDAVIDLADASHIAIQGMTRSGKSAFCYTVFGQLIESDAIRVTGIDPNRVLLEPLAEATDSSNFVLGNDPLSALRLLDRTIVELENRLALVSKWKVEALGKKHFNSTLPVHVVMLEEYAGLIRSAALYDEGLKPAERVGSKIKQRVARLVSEGAKAGIRVMLITQRMDAAIVDGDSRGQFGVRITMGVDNGDAVRMLHPEADKETIKKVVSFPPGRALLWQRFRERFMQADFTPYDEYRDRLGLPPAPEPNYDDVEPFSAEGDDLGDDGPTE